MNRDTIINLAREAGLTALLRDTQKTHEALERFAALVAAEVGIAQYQRGYAEGKVFEREQCAVHYLGIMRKAIEEEREACARIADAELNPYPPEAPLSQYQSGIFTAAEHIAEAIRSRNNNDQT